jgi:hypothetical protein
MMMGLPFGDGVVDFAITIRREWPSFRMRLLEVSSVSAGRKAARAAWSLGMAD